MLLVLLWKELSCGVGVWGFSENKCDWEVHRKRWEKAQWYSECQKETTGECQSGRFCGKT